MNNLRRARKTLSLVATLSERLGAVVMTILEILAFPMFALAAFAFVLWGIKKFDEYQKAQGLNQTRLNN